MSNHYFRFKQFVIEQENCAMKVTTDACIQGAWTPVLPGVKRALDIGAGTGVLSLMLAQRFPELIIDAIEYDADAAAQARQNIESSPWIDRINIINADVRIYDFHHKYDLIISNPPFFSNSLLGDEATKNMARHTLSLTTTDLLKAVEANLENDGYISILLPLAEYVVLKGLLRENGWFEFSKLDIRHREGAPVKRVVALFSKMEISSVAEQTLTIQNREHTYSNEFIELLSSFYLNL